MAVALVVAGAATYTALQGFLLAQLDGNLRSDAHAAFQIWSSENGGRGAGQPAGFPAGTFMALYAPAGGEIGSAVGVTPPGSSETGAPTLPRSLSPGTEDHPNLFSVGGGGVASHYRVAVETLDEAQGNIFVLAEPQTQIDQTLARLLLLEGLVGAVVIVTAGLLAWWLVRVSLTPLARIEGTAAAIAAGDLSRRVESDNPTTEVGRLSLALNAMLTQIERAFAERTHSEQQLREFMAAASHELRTPLTSIRGYAEMLRRGAEGSQADSAQARRRIEEESVRMTGLVDDMLLLARLDQGRPLESQRVDLARVAADAAADARAVARTRRITLDAPDHLWLTGDDARLRQAIGNIVRNAVVHTPARAPIEVSVRADAGLAVIEVADHGRGLEAAERPRIFEPFYRGDAGRSRDRGGSGLGLSIVAAVVAAHGGEVQVLDTPGGGATFRIALPMRDDAQAPAGVELQQQHDDRSDRELTAAG